MDEALQQFLSTTSAEDIHKTAFELHHKWKAEYFWPFVSALRAREEEKRWEAAYSLGFRAMPRAIPFLIEALKNKEESERVRGQAAESLGEGRIKRKVIPALIAGSSDASAEVRFWCVFSLGHFVHPIRTPPQVVRALEARLDDEGFPNQRGHFWPVGWEALAMLADCKTSRFPVRKMFRDFLLDTLREPEAHRDRWSWASCYWRTARIPVFIEELSISRSKGFDPETYGQMTGPIESR